ncbi:hypothetical protein [Microcoleus sp. BR0-C5]|uniref:hypothetical protein n=1 Tax=Microcoleus sp. BR0-C5 TaxID=2818713 RepID=UPI002FD3B0F5
MTKFSKVLGNLVHLLGYNKPGFLLRVLPKSLDLWSRNWFFWSPVPIFRRNRCLCVISLLSAPELYSRSPMEVGRRKKEEAIESIVSAINNVLTVLAVAIKSSQQSTVNWPYSISLQSAGPTSV